MFLLLGVPLRCLTESLKKSAKPRCGFGNGGIACPAMADGTSAGALWNFSELAMFLIMQTEVFDEELKVLLFEYEGSGQNRGVKCSRRKGVDLILLRLPGRKDGPFSN